MPLGDLLTALVFHFIARRRNLGRAPVRLRGLCRRGSGGLSEGGQPFSDPRPHASQGAPAAAGLGLGRRVVERRSESATGGRFHEQARRALTRPRRARSCPRAVRPSVRGRPPLAPRPIHRRAAAIHICPTGNFRKALGLGQPFSMGETPGTPGKGGTGTKRP